MKGCPTILLFVVLLQACALKPRDFSSTSVPSPPDYAQPGTWAAHPDFEDPADRTPDAASQLGQADTQVDVFFLHPTTLVDKPRQWNAALADAKINQKTDETTILYQASIFNAAGRVFAPRYRQAHLDVFFTKNKASAEKALELAYSDVKAAFQHYLEHENGGRPIILAGHSQGALHGKRLLKEFFDGKALHRRLVVAYLVGWPVNKDAFEDIPPCQNPDQTTCVCSWRTFKHGYTPKGYALGDSILVTNPLTWTTSPEPAAKDLNKGAVLRDFETVLPGIADAQIHNGLLWVNKPRFPGSRFFFRRNYHIADLNFFYMDVRENARRRVRAFWK